MIRHFAIFMFTGALAFFIKTNYLNSETNLTTIKISKSTIDEFKKKATDINGVFDYQYFNILLESKINNEILFKEALKNNLVSDDTIIKKRLIQNMKFLFPRNSTSDEILYKKAMDLNLIHNDIVIKNYLVQKMESSLPIEKGIIKPSDEEIQKFILSKKEVYSTPKIYHFYHVFLGNMPTNKNVQNISLKHGLEISKAFHLGLEIKLSQDEIITNFGRDFFIAISKLSTFSKWSGPFNSSFGQHYVWPIKTIDEKLLPLELVKEKVLQEMINQKSEQKLQIALNKLRTNYEVSIEK